MPESRIALNPGYVFVVAASGIAADKTGSAREKYNRASALVAQLLARWNAATGRRDATLATALDAEPDAAARLRALASDALGARLEHFLVEDRRGLAAAVEALTAGRLGGVWRARRPFAARRGGVAGQPGARDDRAGAPCARARRARGIGFWRGFGGSVWALVDAARADAFMKTARRLRRPPSRRRRRAEAFVTRPGPGAGTLD